MELPPPPDQWHDISTFPRFLRLHVGRGFSWIGLLLVRVVVAAVILVVVGGAALALVWWVLLMYRNG